MGKVFASGKYALGICDVCGFQYKLNSLKPVVVKDQTTGIMACKNCWDPSHPQLRQGEKPVIDPQALRNPRPELDHNRELSHDPVEDEVRKIMRDLP
jgi:hypothetical protein